MQRLKSISGLASCHLQLSGSGSFRSFNCANRISRQCAGLRHEWLLVFTHLQMQCKPMQTITAPILPTPEPEGPETEPLLEPGDRLTRDEFERRYERMPLLKKAE